MKKLLTLVFVFTLFIGHLSAQEKMSGYITSGLFVPFNDFTGSDFPGSKLNAFAGIGLGYQISKELKLRGDFTAGSMNGNSGVELFYESVLYEGMLNAQYNLISLFSPKSRWELNANLGLGGVFYNTNLYDFDTRQVLTESPNPASGGLSFNPLIAGGVELAIPITRNIKLMGGYNQRIVIGQDFMDGFERGSNDFYGTLNIGLGFYFGKKIEKGKMEIDRKKYNQMRSSIDSLSSLEPEVDTEQIARMEMANQEKDLKIQAMQMEMDSLRANVVKIDSEEGARAKPDAQAILANKQYRIVVASLPTQAMAQRWIDNSTLDNSEMIIVYVEAVDSYRVIYRSYNSISAAKKDMPVVRDVVADAWIANF
jgi:hypothetical protein